MDGVLAGDSAERIIESFQALFQRLAEGKRETEALAIDLDHDGVETQSEFAAELASLLTMKGHPVLQQLVCFTLRQTRVEKLAVISGAV